MNAEVEEILFRHNATVKGNDGVLEISTAAFSFTPNTRGQQRKLFTWPNISGVKYSPFNDPKGRAMILLKTVLQSGDTGEDGMVLQLVGESKDQNFRELERAKGLISNIRKASKAAASAAVDEQTSKRKAAHKALDIVQLKKQRLLGADRELGRHYKELVEDGNFVTDEEFWTAHETVLQQAISESALSLSSNSRKIGISELLSPTKYLESMVNKMRNANGELDITTQQKQEIFMMIPVLKKAFDEEVEKSKTEEEFWYALFQRVLSGQAARGNSNSGGESNALEDFYVRYGNEQDIVFPGYEAGGKLSGKVEDQMDLTSTFSDYRPREHLDLTDYAEKLAHVGNAMAKKYNKFSSVELMLNRQTDSSINADKSSTRQSELASSMKMTELEQEKEISYIPITLSGRTARQQSSAFETLSSEQEATETTSATATATAAFTSTSNVFLSSKSQKHSKLIQKLSAESKAGDHTVDPLSYRTRTDSVDILINVFELDPPGLLLSDLRSCLPSEQRSSKWFESDLRVLQTLGKLDVQDADVSLANQAQRGDPLETFLNGSSTASLVDGSFTKQQQQQLSPSEDEAGAEDLFSPEFRREVEKEFRDVCELLRHFYTILNRSGEDAPLRGSASAFKVEAILSQLTGKYLASIDAKKSSLKQEQQKQQKKLQQQLQLQHHQNCSLTSHKLTVDVLCGIESLIHRAISNWKTYG